MSSYQSKRSGVQVYHRFCFGAILSGLFSLAIAAIFVYLFFRPVFYLEPVEAGDLEGLIDGKWQFTGLDWVYYVLRHWMPQIDVGQYNALGNYVASYEGDNTMLMFVRNFAVYIEIGLLAFLALATIFGVVVAICGLVYIFTGRNSNTKLAYSMSKSALVFYVLFVGLLLLYTTLAQNIIDADGGPQDANLSFDMIPLILAGVFLALVILLAIVYHVAFKNKVFASRRKRSDEEEEDEEDTFSPRQNPYQAQPMYSQPQVVVMQQGETNNPETLPAGVKEIGDHAFAKNLSLKEANIPYGVPGLGPAAFSNCLNLEKVIIPFSVKDIGYNCFFNTPKLKKIVYLGTVQDWKRVKRGSNWLAHSGTRIIETSNGRVVVYR